MLIFAGAKLWCFLFLSHWLACYYWCRKSVYDDCSNVSTEVFRRFWKILGGAGEKSPQGVFLHPIRAGPDSARRRTAAGAAIPARITRNREPRS